MYSLSRISTYGGLLLAFGCSLALAWWVELKLFAEFDHELAISLFHLTIEGLPALLGLLMGVVLLIAGARLASSGWMAVGAAWLASGLFDSVLTVLAVLSSAQGDRADSALGVAWTLSHSLRAAALLASTAFVTRKSGPRLSGAKATLALPAGGLILALSLAGLALGLYRSAEADPSMFVAGGVFGLLPLILMGLSGCLILLRASVRSEEILLGLGLAVVAGVVAELHMLFLASSPQDWAFVNAHFLKVVGIMTVPAVFFGTVSLKVQDYQESSAPRRLDEIRAETERVAQDLTQLIDTANAPIFGIDSDGLINEWNQAAARITGYPKSDVMGRDLVGNFITDEYKQSVGDVLSGALEGTETANFEFPLYTASGDRVQVLLNATTRRDASGEITGVVGVGQDITELDEIRAETERVAQDLTQLIDTANAPIFGIDADGLVNEWNQTAARITGYAKSDVMGRDLVKNFITDEYKQSVGDVLSGALEGTETANFEFPLYTASGDRVQVLLNATTRRDASGEITGVVGVGQDITELDEIRAETERVAQDLTQLIDTANAPIFGIDADGLINEWNQTAARITGYPKSDVMGRDLVRNFITDEYKQSVGDVLSGALEGTETANFEFPLYTASGDRVQVLLNATPRRDASGEITGVVGVGQDITELDQIRTELEGRREQLARRVDERTRDLLRANAELERANALKDEFLASMSHELRTPLNTVLGMSEALVEGAYGPVNDEQRINLDLIHESGDHLLSLINDILDLSKIEAGQLKLDLQRIDVRELCESSVRMVRQAADKKGLEFRYDEALEIDEVEVDPRRLKQALVNVLVNAVKFTPSGGEIGLSVAADGEGGPLEFIVKDSGVGIPQDQLDQLFIPFRQLDSGLSREHSGTGLGLVITRRMVELHRGSVSLRSKLGEGTTVTITIPTGVHPVRDSPIPNVSDVTSQGLTASSGSRSILDGARVLLAEDNENNIRTYAGYLRTKGAIVEVARNGEQAVRAALDDPPDLIIMDIQMPRMDGLDATHELRRHREMDDVPIIALTALVMPGDRERCIAAGASDYLSKPVRLSTLVDKIEQALRARGSRE